MCQVDIVATSVIAQEEQVVPQEQGETRVLGHMLQFNGSHHKDLNVGVAGIGLFQILPGSIQYLRSFGIALHACQDNVEAKACTGSGGGMEALVLQLATLHTSSIAQGGGRNFRIGNL